MIGILFIYWIWKAFTNLALEYGKNKWKYFFFGMVSYYGGVILGGFLVGMVLGLTNGFDSVVNDSYNNAGWSILYIILGGLACYGTHKLLENKLEKERELNRKDGIDEIGVVEEN